MNQKMCVCLRDVFSYETGYNVKRCCFYLAEVITKCQLTRGVQRPVALYILHLFWNDSFFDQFNFFFVSC